MSRAALQITRKQINRWLLVQVLVTLIVAIVFWGWKGSFFAQSAFVGGFLYVLPQWLFGHLWLAYYKASAAPKIVKVFYIGEVIKLLLTASLFVLVIYYLSLSLIACLSGFLVAQVAFWMAPLLWMRRNVQSAE